MKLRLAIVIFILITALGGYSDSIRFWIGELQTVDICDGFCGFLLDFGLWSSQILVIVGIIGAILLMLRKPFAQLICYVYFLGIFVSTLPTVVIMTQRFGPVWMDSSVPYGWELIKLGWPLVGTGLLFFISSTDNSKHSIEN